MLPPGSSPLWPFLYRLAGLTIAPNAYISSGARLLGHRISIGEKSFVNTETLLDASAGGAIRIGGNVALGPRCFLLTGTHEIGGPERRCGRGYGRDIEIGDGAWLGANVIVLAGVTIGPGCVVGAGSVVTQDIPPHVVAAGHPARVLRPLPRESS
jgi:maltose O-acetyltransferase